MGGNKMIYYVLIVTGFLQIAIGACIWINSHQIQKTFTSVDTKIIDTTGRLIGFNYGEKFFEKYEIIEKSTKE
jgi:hypothetical protein